MEAVFRPVRSKFIKRYPRRTMSARIDQVTPFFRGIPPPLDAEAVHDLEGPFGRRTMPLEDAPRYAPPSRIVIHEHKRRRL